MIKLLSNQSSPTMLVALKEALSECRTFAFSISFIKYAGLRLIEKDIIEALNRGAKGKVITSTYQNFTDILTLKKLHEWSTHYPNFEARLEMNHFKDVGFHTKGYLFSFDSTTLTLIGSTNITLFALKRNIEWNAHSSDHAFYEETWLAFEDLWHFLTPLTTELIRVYEKTLEIALERWDMDYVLESKQEKPNSMQRKALKELKRYRDMGVNRALVIAATGSGKTHLAAFDVNYFKPSRMLFVVHRDTILNEAKNVFKRILTMPYTFGLLTGNQKDYDADILFASNLTLVNHLTFFEPESFDYIIFDEVHHAKASTYQKIWSYFKPQFILGLTATPERTEDPESIYDLFENNVPLDLRLREAIEFELVVPFHYYGIRNTLLDYSHNEASKIIKDMAQDNNIAFIIQQLEKHRPDEKLKALAFCVDVNHAKTMSELFNATGYHTTHLVGRHATVERLQAFHALQDDHHPLEIIFTVDILNEGVDLPKVNMVLFLRPTESPIVFLQQLGRGLRKVDGKTHLIVLDFIGNSYKRSVQIVRALGALHPHEVLEKRTLVDLLRTDFQALELPGVKIRIDQLSKEEMIEGIESTNFNQRRYLIKDYQLFKKYLQTDAPPAHQDYLEHDVAPDLMRFLKTKIGQKNNSYYNFLKKIGEVVPPFDELDINIIDSLSSLLPLVRDEEYLIIEALIKDNRLSTIQLRDKIQDKKGYIRDNHLTHAQMHLTSKKLLKPITDELYELNFTLDTPEFKEHLEDLVLYGLGRYDKEFGESREDLKLYAYYSTEQVMLATLQEKVYVYQKGTKIEKDGTVYIFANLKKEEGILEHLKYNDLFVDEKTFLWESETNTTLNKHRGLFNSKVAHLFIRKAKVEDGITIPYTYVGTGKLTNPRVNPNNPKKSLFFDIILKRPLPSYLQFEFMKKQVD